MHFTFRNFKNYTLSYIFLVFPNFHVSDFIFSLMEQTRGGEGKRYHPCFVDTA